MMKQQKIIKKGFKIKQLSLIQKLMIQNLDLKFNKVIHKKKYQLWGKL